MTKTETLTKYYNNNRQRLVDNYTKRCGSVWDAEDVVQEAFTKALTYIDRYNDSEPFSNWMTRIVYHEFCDWKKDNKLAGATVSFDEKACDPIEGNEQRKQFVDNIIKMFDSESRQGSEILNLHFCCNYKIHEVARFLDISENIVRHTVYFFRKRLAKEL